MSISAIIMMIVILSVLWGGLFFFLKLARKQEQMDASGEQR